VAERVPPRLGPDAEPVGPGPHRDLGKHKKKITKENKKTKYKNIILSKQLK
jgi:hypothetical protein